MDILAKKIRIARDRKGLKQADLGALIGVTGAAVGNWERGITKIDDTNLEKLRQVLDLDSITDEEAAFLEPPVTKRHSVFFSSKGADSRPPKHPNSEWEATFRAPSSETHQAIAAFLEDWLKEKARLDAGASKSFRTTFKATPILEDPLPGVLERPYRKLYPLLPEEYARHVRSRVILSGLPYVLDYISEKLFMTVINQLTDGEGGARFSSGHINGNSLWSLACAKRHATGDRPNEPPRAVLAVVTDEPNSLSMLHRRMVEGKMFDVDVLTFPAFQDLAGFVVSVERDSAPQFGIPWDEMYPADDH